MATTTSPKGTSSPADVPEIAQQLREQLLSTVKQGQQLSVDAVQTWVKAVSALPVPELPRVPGAPSTTSAGVEAATVYGFDVAADLLGAQRDFALRMTKALTPEKSA